MFSVLSRLVDLWRAAVGTTGSPPAEFLVVPPEPPIIFSPARRAENAPISGRRAVLSLEGLAELSRGLDPTRRPAVVCVHVQEIHKRLLNLDLDVSLVASADVWDTGDDALPKMSYASWMRSWCDEPGPTRTYRVSAGRRRVLPALLAPFDCSTEQGECPVCYELRGDLVAPPCKHRLCQSCVGALRAPRCPSCRAEPCVWYGGPPQVASVVYRVLRKTHLGDHPVLVVDDRGVAAVGNLTSPRLTTESCITAAAALKFASDPVVVASHPNERVLEFTCRYLRRALRPKKVYACLVID